MSYLDHRCGRCGHWATHHDATASREACADCYHCDQARDLGAAEVHTTFRASTTVVLPLVPPGSRIGYGNGDITAHDCPECHIEYERLERAPA